MNIRPSHDLTMFHKESSSAKNDFKTHFSKKDEPKSLSEQELDQKNERPDASAFFTFPHSVSTLIDKQWALIYRESKERKAIRDLVNITSPDKKIPLPEGFIEDLSQGRILCFEEKSITIRKINQDTLSLDLVMTIPKPDDLRLINRYGTDCSPDGRFVAIDNLETHQYCLLDTKAENEEWFTPLNFEGFRSYGGVFKFIGPSNFGILKHDVNLNGRHCTIKLYHINQERKQVQIGVIDIGVFGSENLPEHFGISPSGKFLFVTDAYSRTLNLWQLDPVSNSYKKLERQFDRLSGPNNPLWIEGDNLLFTCNQDLVIYDTSINEVRTIVPKSKWLSCVTKYFLTADNQLVLCYPPDQENTQEMKDAKRSSYTFFTHSGLLKELKTVSQATPTVLHDLIAEYSGVPSTALASFTHSGLLHALQTVTPDIPTVLHDLIAKYVDVPSISMPLQELNLAKVGAEFVMSNAEKPFSKTEQIIFKTILDRINIKDHNTSYADCINNTITDLKFSEEKFTPDIQSALDHFRQLDHSNAQPRLRR